MLKQALVSLFCCLDRDPCVLSRFTQTGPKHGDEISQLELMSAGHLRLKHPPCVIVVCFVCKASAARKNPNLILQTGNFYIIFFKDLNAVNNSKPSLTRFTPAALCNLSGLPCASSNACIMLKCKSVSCQSGGRESLKKESLKGSSQSSDWGTEK